MLSTLLFFTLALHQLATVKSDNTAPVVIIGGGISGLTTGYYLRKSGFTNVTVVEAGSKIGGRVNSVPVPSAGSIVGNTNAFFDLGAEYLYTSTATAGSFFTFVNTNVATALRTTAVPGTVSYLYTGNSCRMSGPLGDDLQGLSTVLLNMVTPLARQVGQTMSLGELYQTAYNTLLQNNPLITGSSRSLYDAAFQLTKKQVESFNGYIDWNNVSARQISEYTGVPTSAANRRQLTPNGNSLILNFLQTQIGQNSILLNTAVNRIVSRNGQPIQVQLSNGRVLSAAHVIVTVSMGVLKQRASTLFDPPLPPTHSNIINSMGFGSLDKFAMMFSDRFWAPDTESLSMMRVQNDPWNCNYRFRPAETSISRTMWYFKPDKDQPNVLNGYIGGGLDVPTYELQADSAVTQAAVDTLKSITKNNNIQNPTVIFRSKWGMDPLQYGAYSYYTKECDAIAGCLRQTLYTTPASQTTDATGRTNLVIISGEATQTTFGTTNGAYDSGLVTAQRICTTESVTFVP